MKADRSTRTTWIPVRPGPGRKPGRKPGPSGQGLVEFCLAFPLLLLIFGIVLDFGYYFLVDVSLNTVVREAGMKAVYDGEFTDAQIRDSMLGSVSWANLQSSEVTVSTTQTVAIGAQTYRVARITVLHQHSHLLPIFWFSSTPTTMRVNYRATVMPGQKYEQTPNF